MYKSDRQRVEDAIIPAIIMVTLLRHSDPAFSESIKLLSADVEGEIDKRKGIQRRLLGRDPRKIEGVVGKVITYCEKNNWKTNKVFMVMSYIANSLIEQGVVLLKADTIKILEEINQTVIKGYSTVEGIKEVDQSAAKQAPKVMQLILDEGYF